MAKQDGPTQKKKKTEQDKTMVIIGIKCFVSHGKKKKKKKKSYI